MKDTAASQSRHTKILKIAGAVIAVLLIILLAVFMVSKTPEPNEHSPAKIQ